PTAHSTSTRASTPRSSPANMSTGTSPAESVTTCRKKRRKPSPRRSSTSRKLDRQSHRFSSAALYLDFETDFHDLGRRNPEIRRRQIGIKVHRGEDGFSPGRHAGRLAARDHYQTSEIIRDVLRIDAMQFRLETRKLHRLHHVRRFHESEMKEDAGDA